MHWIRLTGYKPDALTFHAELPQTQVAVFSDIFYPKGWKAFIDGEETEIFRANYVLRALVIPSGNHTIEFRFEPRTFQIGNALGYAGSVSVLLLLGFFAFHLWKKHKKEISGY